MEPNSTKEHKRQSPSSVNVAIVTISDSRTVENDDSGKLIKDILLKNNHKVMEHTVIPDNKEKIKNSILDLINKQINAIITNGGTGLAKKDFTIETIKPLFEKEISGFAILFQKLSYDEIGSAALLSRATAGVIKNKVIFCLPGSPNACKLALNKLIIPEIGHIIKHLNE